MRSRTVSILAAVVTVATGFVPDVSFDCSMRKLALGYARKIQPTISDTSLQQVCLALLHRGQKWIL